MFFLKYWSPIIATVSLVISTYLLLIHWSQSKTHLQFDSINYINFLPQNIALLVTLTNNSTLPISITNAYFGNAKLIRAAHVTLFDNQLVLHTDEFPVNISPYETKDILMELELPGTEVWEEKEYSIKLITSKKTVTKTVKIPGPMKSKTQLAQLTTKIRRENLIDAYKDLHKN